MDTNKITDSEEYKAMLAAKGKAEDKKPSPVTTKAPVKEKVTVAAVVVEEKIKVPKEPLWPIEPEQLELWKQERARHDKEVEAFMKEIESPAHLIAVQASARVAAQKIIATWPKSKVVEETKEPKVKEAKPKKESRQNRLGQTKLIDDLLKSGKSEKEIFDTVREKIPAYPADKLPKLIKLRQYHVKK